MDFITGDSPITQEILDSLGLQGVKAISRLSIDIVAGEVVTVCLVKAVTGEELKRLAGVIGAHNLAIAGAGKVAITGKLIEQVPPVDPEVELRELASLLRLSTRPVAA